MFINLQIFDGYGRIASFELKIPSRPPAFCFIVRPPPAISPSNFWAHSKDNSTLTNHRSTKTTGTRTKLSKRRMECAWGGSDSEWRHRTGKAAGGGFNARGSAFFLAHYFGSWSGVVGWWCRKAVVRRCCSCILPSSARRIAVLAARVQARALGARMLCGTAFVV